MHKILVSACLLGRPVRYDGTGAVRDDVDSRLARWQDEGRLVPICPEVEGGLGVPRSPAEIVDGDGDDVLSGTARVVTDEDGDVTAEFEAGARAALELAVRTQGALAVLRLTARLRRNLQRHASQGEGRDRSAPRTPRVPGVQRGDARPGGAVPRGARADTSDRSLSMPCGRSIRWVVAWALCVGMLAFAAPARAHGPTPGPTGVVVDGDPAPHVVALTRGLAVRHDDAWTFVCPARWDASGAARARGTITTGLVVPGPDGPWHLTLDPLDAGPLDTQTFDTTSTSKSVTAVAHWTEDPARVRWLVVSGGASPVTDILELDMTGTGPDTVPSVSTVGRLDGVWTDIAVWRDRWHVVRDTQRGAEVAVLDASDATPTLRTEPTDVGVGTHRLRTDAETLHMVTETTGGDVLWRIESLAAGDVRQVASATSRIHGPVDVDGLALVVVDDAIHALTPDGALSEIDGALPYTCLGRAPVDDGRATTREDPAYVCSADAVYRVTASGATTPALFELSQLGPPDTTGLTAARREACEAQWLDFAGHAGLDARGPSPTHGETTSEGCGCRVRERSRDARLLWGFALAILCISVWRRIAVATASPG